ncbi:MAG TPA: hypothetical protein DDZ61_09820 [Aeromonas salmonicida]|nr:hypothetical protein [Aeromonas salmonicida]HBL02892.1 hypothetical protein [Aeromonas salmonicida]
MGTDTLPGYPPSYGFIQTFIKCHISVTHGRHSVPCPSNRCFVMKVFKNLSPRQIARYIKSFHRGSFMVEALGRFEFSGGEINLQSLTCRQTLSLARQINLEVRGLRHTSLLLG